MNKKVLFLDLEETIINSWNSPVLINVEKIKDFIKINDISKINIFSFAIRNDEDKKLFEANMKKMIEDALCVEIVNYPSVKEIKSASSLYTGNNFDDWEFTLLWGKMRAYHDFCMFSLSGCECWLLDDVVQDTTLIIHDKKLILNTVKI